MKRSISDFFETVLNLAVFAVLLLAVAGSAYQVFKPDGGIIQWLSTELSPTMLIVLGGLGLLLKAWLGGIQSARTSDLMFYAAILVGLYFGFRLLISS